MQMESRRIFSDWGDTVPQSLPESSELKHAQLEMEAVHRIVRVGLPGIGGGLIWSRPTAVRIRTPDGGTHLVRVTDVTRWAQLALLSVGVIVSLFIRLASRQRR